MPISDEAAWGWLIKGFEGLRNLMLASWREGTQPSESQRKQLESVLAELLAETRGD